MSNDEYHDSLMNDRLTDSRDKYVQYVISVLDDPDYSLVPIVIDDNTMTYPDGVDLVSVVKVLNRAIEYLKAQIFNDGE